MTVYFNIPYGIHAKKVEDLLQILKAVCLVKRIAYEIAEEHKIELQTPLTHNIELDKKLLQ